jgi:hypothetical protein
VSSGLYCPSDVRPARHLGTRCLSEQRDGEEQEQAQAYIVRPAHLDLSARHRLESEIRSIVDSEPITRYLETDSSEAGVAFNILLADGSGIARNIGSVMISDGQPLYFRVGRVVA